VNATIWLAEDGVVSGTNDVLAVEDLKLVLSPNPVQGILSVSLGAGANERVEHVSVYNLQGELLEVGHYRGKTDFVFLDTQLLAQGMYFVRVETDGGKVVGSKFVKL
jgi:Secretion system C-terminal sorting domain